MTTVKEQLQAIDQTIEKLTQQSFIYAALRDAPDCRECDAREMQQTICLIVNEINALNAERNRLTARLLVR